MLLLVVVATHTDWGVTFFGYDETRLILWYILMIPYLYYSALQISYGYPFSVHGNWMLGNILG